MAFVESNSTNGYVSLQGYDGTQYVTLGQAKQTSAGYMAHAVCKVLGGYDGSTGQTINRIRLIYRPNGSGTARAVAVIIPYSVGRDMT